MSLVPYLPENAPFNAEQRAWLNGFLAGLFSRQPGSSAGAVETAAKPLTPLTIAWGSQTGTSEGLAKKAAKEAGKRGFAPTVRDLASLSLSDLAQEKNLLLITSTYGDGEPPDNAKALWSALTPETRLPPSLRYAVCGLGDTNYTHFCQCAKDFDVRLERCGAQRVHARLDCDLDYEEPFARWLDSALAGFAPDGSAPPSSSTATTASEATPSKPAYSRKQPYPATLLSSTNLSGAGSAKAVHHVAFSLGDSGLAYTAGDALGVVPCNCPELVADVLQALALDGEEAVPGPDGSTLSLRQALTRVYDLGKPTADLVAALQCRVPAGANETASAPFHVIDALQASSDVRLTAPAFTALLKRLAPRLYSISSSPLAHPGEVHLTVGVVKYETAGRARKGVCSTFLAERAVPGSTPVEIFVHANTAFRLPTDLSRPVIMIGPGTGIAPFRAFLEERQATGATGKNWLFFGDQKSSCDFLYRDQLDAWHKSGHLHRLDTAFSRDQAEKIYVQQRMREQGAEFFRWLEKGAHVYVCGDAARMAKDVDTALHEIIQKHGGKNAEEAAAYVGQLKASKRYARDVY